MSRNNNTTDTAAKRDSPPVQTTPRGVMNRVFGKRAVAPPPRTTDRPRSESDPLRARLALTCAALAATATTAPSSEVERLPSTLLCEVFACLGDRCLLGELLNVSRAIRAHVRAPGALRTLRLRSAQETGRAVRVLPAAAWSHLAELKVDTRAYTPELAPCLRLLDTRLRVLRLALPLDVAEECFAAVPPRTWGALETFDLALEKPQRPSDRESSVPLGREPTGAVVPHEAARRPGASHEATQRPGQAWAWPPLSALAHLGVSYDDPRTPSIRSDACIMYLLRAAGHGGLRVLSLTCAHALLRNGNWALRLVAPTLEALSLQALEPIAVFQLPPLPRVHTLVLCGMGGYLLSATPHLALRHLYLRSGAQLEVEVEAAAAGDGFALDSLLTLVCERAQSYPRLLARLEPACHTLRTLSLQTLLCGSRENTPSVLVAPAQEVALYRVWPVLARAAAALEDLELRVFWHGGHDPHDSSHGLQLELSKFVALRTLRLARELLPPAPCDNGPSGLPGRARVWAAASLRTLVVLDATPALFQQIRRVAPVHLPHLSVFGQARYHTPLPRVFAAAALSVHSPDGPTLVVLLAAPTSKDNLQGPSVAEDRQTPPPLSRRGR